MSEFVNGLTTWEVLALFSIMPSMIGWLVCMQFVRYQWGEDYKHHRKLGRNLCDFTDEEHGYSLVLSAFWPALIFIGMMMLCFTAYDLTLGTAWFQERIFPKMRAALCGDISFKRGGNNE